MTTATITIACPLLSRSGRHATEGVPFRQLETWVQDLRRQIPDDEEASCVVIGTEHLVAQYEHRLSPEEILAQRLDQLEALRREVAGILGRPGTILSADEIERLRTLVGG